MMMAMRLRRSVGVVEAVEVEDNQTIGKNLRANNRPTNHPSRHRAVNLPASPNSTRMASRSRRSVVVAVAGAADWEKEPTKPDQDPARIRLRRQRRRHQSQNLQARIRPMKRAPSDRVVALVVGR